MEGPVNGHIYATIDSVKCDLDLTMTSPLPLTQENHTHKSNPRAHRYIPPGSPGQAITTRHNPTHGEHRRADQTDQKANNNHRTQPHQHSSRKYAENDTNYYSSSQESNSSRRVTSMWSPSSDMTANEGYESLALQQTSGSLPSKTQTEIDKLDDLLQELTPRLNDSPSEYLRRRRQSFSNSSKSTTFEGRDRQDTFIQGFSPTSPFDGRVHPESLGDRRQQSSVTSAIKTRNVDRSCVSQSNEGVPTSKSRHSNWHTEEKKKLQRARSLLDEKDRFLTEQLRRYQTRQGPMDSSTMSPLGYRPGSSQQMMDDTCWPDRYSSIANKNYAPVSEWEDVRRFSDQYGEVRARRATSEMDYPLRDMSIDRRNQSPVGGLVGRRRTLLRNMSDNPDTQLLRTRYIIDNDPTSMLSYRAYSPLHVGTHNGAPTIQDSQLDYVDDIPQIQRRNIRNAILASRLLGNIAYQVDATVGINIRDRNIDGLSMVSTNSNVGGARMSPAPRTVDIIKTSAGRADMDRGMATPELLKKSHHAGFQIRADNGARSSGICYYDDLNDDGPLSSETYPLGPTPTGPSRRDRSSSGRMDDTHYQSSILDNEPSRRDYDSDSTCLPQTRTSTNPIKPANAHNSSNSSIRKSSKIWYQPNMTREDAIEFLRLKPPGTFVVRQSHTFNNSYGLAVKVTKTQPNDGDDERHIRHFLIESTSKGVRIRGCTNEPYFGSLTALVYQHTLTKLALPCCIILPGTGLESDSEDQQVTFEVPGKCATSKSSTTFVARTFVALYLGSIDTDQLTGPAAIAKAVEVLIENRAQVKHTEVSIRVSSEGVTLTDVLRKLFFRRHYPLTSLSYCGTENNASWDSSETRSRGIAKARIFGFVARKTSVNENMCHMLCDGGSQDSARSITHFIAGCIAIS